MARKKRRGDLRQRGWNDFGFSNREILYLLGMPKKNVAWVDWYWRKRVCAKLHVSLAQSMRELGMDPPDREDRRIAVRALWDTIKERIFPNNEDRREELTFQRDVVKELLQEIFNDERTTRIAQTNKSTNPTGTQGSQQPSGQGGVS